MTDPISPYIAELEDAQMVRGWLSFFADQEQRFAAAAARAALGTAACRCRLEELGAPKPEEAPHG